MKVKYFKNGKIYSMQKYNDFYSHMLSIDGKIVFTSDEDISISRYMKNKDCEIETIDLEGKTVLPSFCDAHIHFVFGAKTFDYLALQNFRSADEILSRIKEVCESRKWLPGGWIIATGYDKNNLGTAQEITRAMLDNVSLPFSNRNSFPIKIVIISKDYHSAIVNNSTINALHLDNGKRDRILLKILKENKLTIDEYKKNINLEKGLFFENSLKILTNTLNKVLNEDDDYIKEKIIHFIHYMQKFGITAVTDCSLLWADSSFRYYQKLENSDLLFRNCVCIPEDALERFIDWNLVTGTGSSRFKTGPLKLIYDGSLGSQTAFLYQPYANGENYGYRNYDPKIIHEKIEKAVKYGVGLAIHAIGDRANKEVLDLFSRARSLDRNLLLRLEHAQMLLDTDVSRIKNLNVIPVMQPIHIDQDYHTTQMYISDRKNLSYRLKSILEHGNPIALSTDFPVASLNPWEGIFSAVTQRGLRYAHDYEMNPSEKISLFEAVKGYTYGSHYASLFRSSGLLIEGYNADLITMENDPFQMDIESVPQIKILDTYFEGERICT